MALNFPSSPVNGQTFGSAGGPTYRYNSATGVWDIDSAGGSGNVFVSDTKPSNPFPGMRWYRSTDMKEFIYYADADGAQWIETSYSDVQRPPSDGKSYVMKDGVWQLAPIEYVADKFGTGTTYVEVDLPADIDWFDFEFYDMRPTSGSANYIILQMYVNGAWQASNGNYNWTNHYFNSGNHSYWYHGSVGGFTNCISLTSGAVSFGSSTAWGFGKLFAGTAGISTPQTIYTAISDGSRSDGDAYYTANARATKFRVGLTGATALVAAANLRVKGLR